MGGWCKWLERKGFWLMESDEDAEAPLLVLAP